jgi:hypothetical protein
LKSRRHVLIQIFELPSDMLDDLQRAEDVAVPEIPFDPFQLTVQCRQIVIRCGRDQLLELLPQHRDAHGDLKPVEQMLSQRAQVQLEVADVVSTVGEKRDRLIHLQPLRLEQFGQPTLGFGVVARHEAKALGRAVGRHALADDQFEPTGLPVVTVPGVNVAAVNPDGQRASWPWQRIPVALAALDEEWLLIAELTLKPLGHLLDMLVDRGPVRLEW